MDEAMAAEMADFYGISAQQARSRVRQQRASIELKESLGPSVSQAWGGGTVDQANGGTRRWFVTTEAARQETQASADIRLGKGAVTVQVVDHTLAELEAAADQLSASLQATGVTFTDISVEVETNNLSVGIPSNRPTFDEQAAATPGQHAAADTWDTNAQLAEEPLQAFEAGTGVSVIRRPESTSEIATPVACTPDPVATSGYHVLSCDNPLRGGPMIDVTPAGGLLCSAGFQVRSTIDNKLYLLTAGHCLANHDTGQAGIVKAEMPKSGYSEHVIGSWWHGVYNSTDGDGAIITVDRPDDDGWQAGWPIVFVAHSSSSGKDTTRDESYVIEAKGNWDTLDTNDWLCKTGGIDFTDCGRYDGSYQGSVHWFRRFETMRTCTGDSGGPIIGNGRGWGIMGAGLGSPVITKTYVTHDFGSQGTVCYPTALVMALARPMAALNVRLVTSADP